MDCRERLHHLALEPIDHAKGPYFMRNHLGIYECKLCLTLHNNEGNYLAHTQGKQHLTNLAKRAAHEAKEASAQPQPHKQDNTKPRHRVMSLYEQIDYPEIEDNTKPRHRVMSSYEQVGLYIFIFFSTS
ncbi:hypothetical protein REPUB_Repub02eG0234900 [Reevesia pubescens]